MCYLKKHRACRIQPSCSTAQLINQNATAPEDICGLLGVTHMALSVRYSDQLVRRGGPARLTDSGHASAFIQLYAFSLRLWNLLQAKVAGGTNPCADYDPATPTGLLSEP